MPEAPGFLHFDEVASAATPAAWPAVVPDDVALLQYTGGTTGLPKGAILSHANLTAAVEIGKAWSIPQATIQPGEGQVICVLPLFHMFAMTAVPDARPRVRQRDPAAPALRRRETLARHSEKEGDDLLRRADDVDRASPTIPASRRSISPRCIGAHSGGAPVPIEIANGSRRSPAFSSAAAGA